MAEAIAKEHRFSKVGVVFIMLMTGTQIQFYSQSVKMIPITRHSFLNKTHSQNQSYFQTPAK